MKELQPAEIPVVPPVLPCLLMAPEVLTGLARWTPERGAQHAAQRPDLGEPHQLGLTHVNYRLLFTETDVPFRVINLLITFSLDSCQLPFTRQPSSGKKSRFPHQHSCPLSENMRRAGFLCSSSFHCLTIGTVALMAKGRFSVTKLCGLVLGA